MLSIFDVNAVMGTRLAVAPGSFTSTPQLLQAMDHYGIDRALVYHAWAREYDAMAGNYELLSEIAGYDRLYGCFVVTPPHPGEFGDPAALVALMREHNIRAVRMFPAEGDGRFLIDEPSCGSLFSVLAAHRLPLLLDIGGAVPGDDPVDWQAVHWVCGQFPRMPVILMQSGNRVGRKLYPYLQRFPNLYIDLSSHFVHRGIEFICRHYGAGRRTPEPAGL